MSDTNTVTVIEVGTDRESPPGQAAVGVTSGK